MDKVTIHISANEQLLTSAECPLKVASNTVSYIEAVFELGENWTGYDSVRAVWSTYMDTIATVLDSEGKCVVPHEVMTRTQKVFVNLVGSVVEDDELTDRLTTYPILAVVVNADALVEGTETAPITPSQFEQFVNEVSEEVSKIKDIVSTTLNDDYTLTFVFSDGTETTVGPIRGEQGEQGIQGIQGPPGPPGEVTLATLESLMPTDTANGSIASFPDGQNVFPLKSLVADINPIQDLHGYANPWVGGGGKNKLCTRGTTTTINDVTFTVNADGSIKVKGTASANARFNISHQVDTLVAGTYTLSGGYSNNVYITLLDKDGAFPISGGVIDYGSGKTFTLASDLTQYSCRLMVLSGTAVDTTIYPQIELGSSATSYAPYSNICPISGWNSVGVVDCGVNLFNEQMEIGKIDTTNGAELPSTNQLRSGFIKVLPSSKIYVSMPTTTMYLFFYDTNKNYIGYTSQSGSNERTLANNVGYIRLMLAIGYGTTYNHDVSINYPSTYTNYIAYNGNTYTTTLPSTVYGGTLDVVNGSGDNEFERINMGSLSWSYSGTPRYWYAVINGIDTNVNSGQANTIMCECYDVTDTIIGPSSLTDGQMTQAYGAYANLVEFRDSRFESSTSAQVKSALDGLYLLYKKATPTPFTTTPTTINTLKATNNIFADSGNVSVTYKADTQLWVEKKLSE